MDQERTPRAETLIYSADVGVPILPFSHQSSLTVQETRTLALSLDQLRMALLYAADLAEEHEQEFVRAGFNARTAIAREPAEDRFALQRPTLMITVRGRPNA